MKPAPKHFFVRIRHSAYSAVYEGPACRKDPWRSYNCSSNPSETTCSCCKKTTAFKAANKKAKS